MNDVDAKVLDGSSYVTLGARGHLTGGYMLITLWFFKQFVHTFPRRDMLITF